MRRCVVLASLLICGCDGGGGGGGPKNLDCTQWGGAWGRHQAGSPAINYVFAGEVDGYEVWCHGCCTWADVYVPHEDAVDEKRIVRRTERFLDRKPNWHWPTTVRVVRYNQSKA